MRTWAEDGWRADIETWIDMACETYALSRISPIDLGNPSIRSIHARVQTDAGQLYFKALAPGQIFEARLTSATAGLTPAQFVMPLAIDPARGWMLSSDYGATLASMPLTHELWARALGSLGRAQINLIPYEETLFDTGLQVMDPTWLPEEFNNALMLHASLPLDHPLGIPASDADHAYSALGDIEQACTKLSEGTVPLSLEHGSFDLSRAFAPTEETAHSRLLNLSNSHWSHPFASLARPIERMCIDFRTTADDPRIMQAIGAYLAEFEEFGAPDELYELVAPALRIAPLLTHATWIRLLADADPADMMRWAPKVLEPLALVASSTE
ncbi:hypothetical protein CQ018_14650 [Arthrobacter sp. MYb227]|uniref:hypothetical protein n=1 Tax=Arthrobacter sp. MYb227 TaxID=1848601 RepID=UPI000D4A9093|nr:hypothetical protein [Arthrobacter sp. MYb227]PQZ90233.1 hypothetical protein CQ018_14650 [Arthrobacter sp. MYb227]